MLVNYCESLLLECRKYVPDELKKNIDSLLSLREDMDEVKEKFNPCFDVFTKDEFKNKFEEIIFNSNKFKDSYFHNNFKEEHNREPELKDVKLEEFDGYEIFEFVKNKPNIDFDLENFETNDFYIYGESICNKILGIQTLENELTFLGFYAGGDWEVPIIGILYIYKNEIYCYIPEDGNIYDKENMCAYNESKNDIIEVQDEDIIISDILRKFCKNVV